MQTQAPVSTRSKKGKNTIWFILGGAILACCCGVAVIAGAAGFYLYTTSSTTISSQPSPVESYTSTNPQLSWLVTADELNSFSTDIGIVQWELVKETPGEYRVCHTFSGTSWSVNPNQASNCILQSASNSLDEVIASMIEAGQLYPDEVPVETSLNLDGEYALYAGTFDNGHSLYDLLLLQGPFLYWASVSVATPAGMTPVDVYQSAPQVIDSFLESMIRINLERSK